MTYENMKLLTEEEERELGYRIKYKKDREAVNTLIVHNISYVIWISKKFANCGLPMEDVIQNGMLGLIKAAWRFDPDKETRFITLADRWIKQSICYEFAATSNMIRVPKYAFTIYLYLKKYIDTCVSEGLPEPTVNEISEKFDLPTDKAKTILESVKDVVSLDRPVEGDDGVIGAMNDLIPGNSDTEAEAIERASNPELYAFLKKTLTERQLYVLICRYGLFGVREQPLRVISKKLGVSGERVRQLEKDAIKKLQMRKTEAARYL